MPGSSYVTVTPFSQIYAPTIKSWKLGASMFVAFGGLALVLAAIGLYSVIAYNVAQRTHELGVRVAFGAQVGDVIRLVLTEGLRLAVAGVVIGGGLALYAGRWVAPLLFKVKPTDPLVFGFVIAVLLAVATLASLIPAIRAARVDPNVALRSD
jgi:ABC-type antimicrobial peptide transport system permease subunit